MLLFKNIFILFNGQQLSMEQLQLEKESRPQVGKVPQYSHQYRSRKLKASKAYDLVRTFLSGVNYCYQLQTTKLLEPFEPVRNQVDYVCSLMMESQKWRDALKGSSIELKRKEQGRFRMIDSPDQKPSVGNKFAYHSSDIKDEVSDKREGKVRMINHLPGPSAKPTAVELPPQLQSIVQHQQQLNRLDQSSQRQNFDYKYRQRLEPVARFVPFQDTFYVKTKTTFKTEMFEEIIQDQQQLKELLSAKKACLKHQFYNAIKKDSAPFLERFKTFSWETRKSLYYFFKEQSKNMEDPQHFREWFARMLYKFHVTSPNISQIPEKRVPFKEIFQEILKGKTRYSLEKFSQIYCPDHFKIVRYFQALTGKEDETERAQILRYFEEGSREQVLSYVHSKWFRMVTASLKAVKFPKQEKPEPSFEEKKKIKLQELKKEILKLKPLGTGQQYEEFCQNYCHNMFGIQQVFRQATCEEQRIILAFFRGSQRETVQKQMSAGLIIWFKKEIRYLLVHEKSFIRRFLSRAWTVIKGKGVEQGSKASELNRPLIEEQVESWTVIKGQGAEQGSTSELNRPLLEEQVE